MKLGSEVIEFKVMTFAREILGLLLIAALGMATLVPGPLTAANHAFGSSAGILAAPGERPAGCHGHGRQGLPGSRLPQSPPPAPASYQCCLTGHDAAVVQASFYTPPSQHWTQTTLQIMPALTKCSFNGSKASRVFSADPPRIAPLRI